MTKKEKEAIKHIVEYLEKDERNNWEENDCPKTNHIYLDIKILQKFLRKK